MIAFFLTTPFVGHTFLTFSWNFRGLAFFTQQTQESWWPQLNQDAVESHRHFHPISSIAGILSFKRPEQTQQHSTSDVFFSPDYPECELLKFVMVRIPLCALVKEFLLHFYVLCIYLIFGVILSEHKMRGQKENDQPVSQKL